jgi:hypothetical protein
MLSALKYVHNYALLSSITGLVHTQTSLQALHLMFTISIRHKYTSHFLIDFHMYYVVSRHFSRFFDCLEHPNLSATLATDQK